MREKDRGIWQTYSLGRHASPQVKTFALGLAALGCDAGDKLAIIGGQPTTALLGVTAAHVWRHPRSSYQDAIAKEMQYVARSLDSCMVVAEDQEQVDRPGDQASLSKLKQIIYDNPKACGTTTIPC